MLAWLSKIDPNTVVALVSALALYVYHQLSPAVQQKIADALNTALDTSDKVMAALVAAAPAGTTKADLEAELWTAAKVQLEHIGLDPDKLPPAAQAAAKALVDKYLASRKLTAS
jgi:hypothetical protein